MTPDLLAAIAERFKVLGEPARLQILQTLRRGERTVSELVEETGMGQANVSKHLQQLLAHGFVIRRKEGLYAWYRLADQDVFRLCDIMCGGLERDVAARRKLLAAG
jgi:DNA-binding transcriptional ArsR family regulator